MSFGEPMAQAGVQRRRKIFFVFFPILAMQARMHVHKRPNLYQKTKYYTSERDPIYSAGIMHAGVLE